MNFLQPYNYCMYPYRPQIYYNLYAENIQEQNSAATTYKQEVVQWLFTLEQSELYKLFQIKGQIKTFPILKMYIHDKQFQPSNYALLQQATIKLESKIDDQFIMKTRVLHKKTDELYEKLMIFDDENFLDTIIVNEPHLENLNNFIELLDEISDKYFLSTSPKANLEKAEDPVWFHQNSFHSCSAWIIKEFEKNINFYYNIQRDKKKKYRLQKQMVNKNNSKDLQEYFERNLANNKEKLNYYFEQIYTDIKEHPNELENIFYENIFSGTAIKLIKSQVELSFNFQQKCHSDPNIINSMLIFSMSDLLDQKTYFLKKFYQIVIQLFQEHLENELFSSEISIKKKKDKKKSKKKKSEKIEYKKTLDPIELNQRLSSKNLQESNILRFQRSYSQNNFAYSYVTPPNTPSAWENSDDQNEINSQSQQSQNQKQQNNENQKRVLESIIDLGQENISQAFVENLQNPTNDDFVEYTQSLTQNILNTVYQSLIDENVYKEEVIREKKKIKKKQKTVWRSIPESRDEQMQLQSPESEITRFSVETQAQTIKSLCSNRTASTSEEEKKQRLKTRKSACQFEQQETESISSSNQTQDNNLKEQIENVQQKAQQKLIDQINFDILEFTDNIMNDYEEMLPFRLLTFDRIKLVIQKVFYGIPDDMIQLFGSCATGLALIDSDIDIGISGFQPMNRNIIKALFDNLFFEFSKRKWVIKSNPIFNSVVPVIKLEIDPQVSQTEFEGRNLNETDIHKWKKLKQKIKSCIKVDISFNFSGSTYDSLHSGFITTNLVKQWMKEYPVIQQLVLILKSIIKKLGLSESYTGGLSSYSLIIMVYSYLRENRVAQNQIGEQFIDFLKYFVNEFNSSTTGIGLLADIKNPQSSYFFNLQDYCLPQLPITIFNPFNRKLLTNSCVHIGKIFDFFKVTLDQLEQKREFYCNYVILGKKKQQKLNKTMGNFITNLLQSIK
ncbi:unnamed protein product [Paramecium pentaurelia]|uniref:Polymerase nucleotidyl transferase domain-containing protein n=1 Tax=Paramecium pentaurelia TaxID=43138 RepID=A0A8S1S6S0_9CILI|nr:unnamed protein product [Paramecium pentaurelia]